MTFRIETPEERRRRAEKEAFDTSVRLLMVRVVMLPLEALVLMAALAAVHTVAAPVVAAGYWTSLLLMLGVNLLVSVVKRFRR
ncbi:hypothetical protein [Streptomyces asiaticus]|uniref:hypothetical protein n=1 Tax=Streptomyces asiaticus TaxID=114695 RepID=UPI001BA81311|nr:hypothetical protein [Streptomyces asiaticus]